MGWAVGCGGEGDILSLLLNLLITLVILREKRYSVNNRKVRFIHLVSYKVERRGCGLENRKTDDSETRSLKRVGILHSRLTLSAQESGSVFRNASRGRVDL